MEKIRSEVFSLSPGERAELAHFLIQSLELESDDDAETAWDAELERRAAGIRAGTATGIPAEEVFRTLRAGKL